MFPNTSLTSRVVNQVRDTLYIHIDHVIRKLVAEFIAVDR